MIGVEGAEWNRERMESTEKRLELRVKISG